MSIANNSKIKLPQPAATNKKSRGKKAVISSRFRLEFMIKRIANLEVPTRTLIALIYF